MNNLNHPFWGKAVDSDHFLQVYESDEELFDSMEAFVSAGFVNGDAVVVVASESHLEELESRLEKIYNVKKLFTDKRYLPINVEEVISYVIVDGKVDEANSASSLENILNKVHREPGGKIRVYGETSPLLYERGNYEAAAKLERIGEEMRETGLFLFLCAYPKALFRQDEVNSVREICSCHSSLLEENKFTNVMNFYGETIPVSASQFDTNYS